ncbi:MAG: bifunctional glutamate N-acetyltransferase/amino-acid acetyltransferase ArgJ [Alphaproteobacteria bacterium]|nr:bifunctional glutamate N-acetyltransferase/amino-acid acetyltransferase ArgJ [Alphaproteobacteria bacterium]
MAPKIIRSPLAPKRIAKPKALSGLRLHVMASGARYKRRDDFLLIELNDTATVAGVFTKSKMPSAAVDLSRANLISSKGRARAILVNAGNANAFTGQAGAKAAALTATAAAKKIGCRAEQVLIASTGVIGETLETKPLLKALETGDNKKAKKTDKENKWQSAARAIMTTDTFPKLTSATAKFGNQTVTLTGIAKGSGMIAPDMATMLAFIFTDAALPVSVLQKLLQEANADSFNCVTVDSDTSTSDTCFLAATGAVKINGAAVKSANDKRLAGVKKALADIMQNLAEQVARDGEGASKLMTIEVSGAENDAAARRIGLAIGNSPLVKTAIAGADANWGRIVMAVGKSGEKAERDRLAISIGGIKVARGGKVVPGYKEAPVARHMKNKEISIAVNVGVKQGKGRARIWASDLTHGYISINADYRS